MNPLAVIQANLTELLALGARRIGVFGSFARGEAGDDSDIDVLLVAASEEDVVDWDPQIDLLRGRVQMGTGNRCSCMAFSAERVRQLAVQREPIVDNWLKDGLVLVGDSLRHLLDQLPPTKSGASRAGRR